MLKRQGDQTEMLGSVSRSGDGARRWILRPVPIVKVDGRIMGPSSTSEGTITMSAEIGFKFRIVPTCIAFSTVNRLAALYVIL